VLLGVTGIGCGAAHPPLQAGAETPEALARAVLDAIAARDQGRLEALALSEAEFRQRVWPELPASRPERNIPVEFAWKDLAQKSRASLSGILAEHGGQRFALESVGFLGSTSEYSSFDVSRKAELVVRTTSGSERRIRVFGSMIRADGRVKVFSFVVD
jgi:hypothetical protein